MANYKRVNKPTARKIYNLGYDITLLPCKVTERALDGSHAWIDPVTINATRCVYDYNRFDRVVNEYEHYNCNAELGYYAHYFVSEEVYNNYLKEDSNNGIKESK